MEYTVLLAEDQVKLGNVVRDYFVSRGLGCDPARDGAELVTFRFDYALLILQILAKYVIYKAAGIKMSAAL